MPLMLPFYDTRFWYHALIGQMSQSWHIPMLLTGEMSRSFNSGKRCVLKDFEQAIQILSTMVTWTKKIELKAEIQKTQYYNHAPTKGMMNTKNWRLSYPFHCLALAPYQFAFTQARFLLAIYHRLLETFQQSKASWFVRCFCRLNYRSTWAQRTLPVSWHLMIAFLIKWSKMVIWTR